jgi:hypothetical protein
VRNDGGFAYSSHAEDDDNMLSFLSFIEINQLVIIDDLM